MKERIDMKEMTLLEHLKELKDRVKVSLMAIAITTVIMMVVPAQLKFGLEEAIYAYKPLVSVLLDMIRDQLLPPGWTLLAIKVTSPLELYFIASLAFGLIFSSPIIGYEVYKYVDPALYPHERRMIYPFLTAFIGLFTAGVIFGYLILAPFTFKAMGIFFDLVGASPEIHVMDFYSMVFTVVVVTGLVFTSPAILVLLVKIGLMSTKTITRNRKYIYGIGYIVSAFITPDGGMFTNLLLLGVFVALIEGAVIVARRYEKEREKEMMEGGGEGESREKEKPSDVCKFCGARLGGRVFCPSCGRAQE